MCFKYLTSLRTFEWNVIALTNFLPNRKILCACHMIFVNGFFFCICICLCFALTINRLKTTLSKSENKSYIIPFLIIMCLQEPEHHQQLIQQECVNLSSLKEWTRIFVIGIVGMIEKPHLIFIRGRYHLLWWTYTEIITLIRHVAERGQQQFTQENMWIVNISIYIYISYKEVILLLLHLNLWSFFL